MNSLSNSISNMQMLDAGTLKVIALLTMLIDHIAAGVLLYLINNLRMPFGMEFEEASKLYYTMRHIGRQAFPIYCFLLTEGLLHTKSVPKYLRNLAIFGVISEPFFDMAVKVKKNVFSTDIIGLLIENKEPINRASNVYFTLLIGLFVIWSMKYVEDRLFEENPFSPIGYSATNPLYALLYFAPVAAGCLLANTIHSDYSWWGVCLIALFYVFRKNRLAACALGYLFIMNMNNEVYALPAFVLLLAYNGEKGRISKKFKYLFYAFYPLHFFILYLIRCYIWAHG